MKTRKLSINKYQKNNHFDKVQRFFNLSSDEIRITFHDPGLKTLTSEDVFCLDFLENIGKFKGGKIKIYSFDKQKSPSIHYLNLANNGNAVEFKLIPEEHKSYFNYKIDFIDRIEQDANRIYYSKSYEDSSIKRIFQGIRDVKAHQIINSDIFITKDIWLIENNIDSVNIMPPRDALKIVTLFHRLNNIFLYPGLSGKTYIVDKERFYWVLVNHNIENLLNLNHFIGNKYDIENELRWISLSIVYRCASCYETLDNISKYYYFYDDDQESFSRLIYYFEYLMLLLVSAFELLQQVINIMYHLNITNNLSFNPRGRSYKPFIEKLQKAQKGVHLCEVLKEINNDSILRLLYIFRNNIHNPSYEKYTKSDFHSEEQVTNIELPYEERGEEIISLANNISNNGEFGIEDYKYKRKINQNPMRNIHSLLIEPFAFSQTITKYSFDLLERIVLSMEYIWGDDFTYQKKQKKNKYSKEVDLYSDIAKNYFRLIY